MVFAGAGFLSAAAPGRYVSCLLVCGIVAAIRFLSPHLCTYTLAHLSVSHYILLYASRPTRSHLAITANVPLPLVPRRSPWCNITVGRCTATDLHSASARCAENRDRAYIRAREAHAQRYTTPEPHSSTYIAQGYGVWQNAQSVNLRTIGAIDDCAWNKYLIPQQIMKNKITILSEATPHTTAYSRYAYAPITLAVSSVAGSGFDGENACIPIRV